MPNCIPQNIKIYHIVHYNKLAAIIDSGGLLCDQIMTQHAPIGSTIGMDKIKKRRLAKTLESYPDLHVGDCVPFYFCSRSVMLYIINQNNHPEVDYSGGQSPIIHLVADLQKVVAWAKANNKRWVFTNSNAGSFYFDDFNDLKNLNKIDWDAVHTSYWMKCQDTKQSEFLIETQFPWQLVEKIGVHSDYYRGLVRNVLSGQSHCPVVETHANWYY